ncbi:MAG: hypothetical protein V1668_02405 [Patescibacteria group bacterium]
MIDSLSHLSQSDSYYARDPLTLRQSLLSRRDMKIICRDSRRRHTPSETDDTQDHYEWCRYCSDGTHRHSHLTNRVIDEISIDGQPVIAVTKKDLDVTIMGPVIKQGDGNFGLQTNIGVDETVAIGSRHSLRMTELPVKLFAASLTMCFRRISDLNGDSRLANIIMWSEVNNLAQEFGFVHPHWHIAGHTEEFPRPGEEMEMCYHHYYTMRHLRCLMCDILTDELRLEQLIVGLTPHFVAFIPRAARHPFETWVVPRQHSSTFESICASQPDISQFNIELAGLLKDLLKKMEKFLGPRCPIELLLYNAPHNYHIGFPSASSTLHAEEIDPCFHTRFRVRPIFAQRSMRSSATGIAFNRLLPSESARLLNMPDDKIDQWVISTD